MESGNSFSDIELLKLTCFKGVNQLMIAEILTKYSNYSKFVNSSQYKTLVNSNETLFGNFDTEFENLAEEQLEKCRKNSIELVPISSEKYPALLRKINYPPAILFVQGTLHGDSSKSVSIVGTRHYSTYGKLAAENFATEIASSGVIVVSGLAYGTDTRAHLAAVKAGGISYAVIASGIDRLSPALSVKNSEKIVESGGAIISEYKCGVNANLGSFPQRNRIIAGISPATLVIESKLKGGSLITARMAFESSREVFAVPGNINSPNSEGTNKLIKDNQASPALSPGQILDELGFGVEIASKKEFEKVKLENDSLRKIYDSITHEPVQVDSIPEKSGLAISEVLVRLLELEFRGLIRQLPGNHYVRIK